ncbi:MAG TPA: hypothetical protein P5262_04910 [Candidatus Moranbacteria bacterium]|nr:hypothetical protein [Candidatus Moranbacteria bacterium]
MKKLFVVALAVLAIASLSAQAFASQQGVNAIVGVSQAYFKDTPSVKDLGNDNYSVAGPGGVQKIKFTNSTINRMNLALNNPGSSESLDTMCPAQANQLRLAMKAPVKKPVTVAPVKPCEGCKEQEGTWKGRPPAGTVTATIKNGQYGQFEIVYDSKKRCPAVQQWRKTPNDFPSEHKRLWFKDKTMAEQWLANALTPEQLEQRLSGASYKAASIGYQKWVDLAL